MCRNSETSKKNSCLVEIEALVLHCVFIVIGKKLRSFILCFKNQRQCLFTQAGIYCVLEMFVPLLNILLPFFYLPVITVY